MQFYQQITQSLTNTLFVPTHELHLAALLVLVISVNKYLKKNILYEFATNFDKNSCNISDCSVVIMIICVLRGDRIRSGRRTDRFFEVLWQKFDYEDVTVL